MPTNQTTMPLYMGLAPGLNAAGQVSGLATLFNVKQITASYTVPITESGTIYNTVGGTATCTFTLPAVATSAGAWWIFHNAVDQTMTITAPSACMFLDGLTKITNVTFSVASHKAGGAVMVYCDGTNYYAFSAANLLAVPVSS